LKTYAPRSDDPAKQAEADAWETWFEKYLPSTEDAREPASDIYYPLIDDLSQIELADGEVEYDLNEHRVVGVIGAIMRWREYLKNILPEDSNGIDVVFRNPCTLAFTYRIYGPEPKYLGVGDLHDKRYDFMEKVAQLADLGQDSSEVYTGVPMNIERCPFTISLYPSSEMEAYHTTSNRVTFTVIAVLIFGFTTLVFCLYDTTVERRQKIVMHTAIRSSAIVSSLFPEDVRERIYGSEDQDQANVKGSLLSYGSKSKDKVGLFAGDPIAELYPETTVLFADIAGFTVRKTLRNAVRDQCVDSTPPNISVAIALFSRMVTGLELGTSCGASLLSLGNRLSRL
jgi:hypothetical protein